MSTKSVKTRAWEELQVERNIRPYRMAVIQVSQTGTSVPTLRVVMSEFGNTVLTTPARSAVGKYLFAVQPGSFRDLNNVVFLTEPGGTTLAGVGTNALLSSAINLTGTIFYVTCVQASAPSTTVDYSGKFNIIIKEYYK
jgi:hypothetical protein